MKIAKIIFRITLFLTISGYAVFQRQVVDLTGVFQVDKYFRDTTIYLDVHHDDIERDCSILEIDDFHRYVRGYENTGFAYNVYVKGGKVYIVHHLDAKGAHTEGYNSNTIGVCFHTADRNDLATQIALILTLRYLMYRYDIPKDRVVGHRDLNSNTVCPNIDMDKLKKWL